MYDECNKVAEEAYPCMPDFYEEVERNIRIRFPVNGVPRSIVDKLRRLRTAWAEVTAARAEVYKTCRMIEFQSGKR
jgi:hypothetical protein